MGSSVLYEIAEMVEFCAAMRAQQLDHRVQQLQAEQAGRELLMTWLLPTMQRRSLSSELQRCLSLVATLLQTSVIHAQQAPVITWDCHAVRLLQGASQTLLNCVMVVVITAWRDGAKQIHVRLSYENGCPVARVEADRGGVQLLPKHILDEFAVYGGYWEAVPYSSWVFVLGGREWADQAPAQLEVGS
jgi:hypothetical protein